MTRECFFCFKQKTAYEMRISDWSSDVCSSDLTLRRLPGLSVANDQGEGRYLTVRGVSPDLLNVTLNGQTAAAPAPDSRQVKDRKSVVSGRSVSVRVDLGGRRLYKQPHHHIIYFTQ